MKMTERLKWRKASLCDRDQPMCVEVARMSDGNVAMRNSRFKDAIVHTSDEFAVFLEGVKAGEFDDLI